MNTRYIMSGEIICRVVACEWLDMGTWSEVAAELDRLRAEVERLEADSIRLMTHVARAKYDGRNKNAELREENDRLRRLYESLTPGGSEFHDNLEACTNWVRHRLATAGKIHAENIRLRSELTSVLDVALARGEKLGYLDDDYMARFAELTGREWSNET